MSGRETMQLDRDYLDELGLPYEDEGENFEVIDRIRGDSGRWETGYELIFRFKDQPEGEAWSCNYIRGNTENQDVGPWQYQRTVTCTKVFKTTKTIEVWE